MTASQTGHFALELFWESNGLARKEQRPSCPRENPQVGLPTEKGLCSCDRSWSLESPLSRGKLTIVFLWNLLPPRTWRWAHRGQLLQATF